VPRGAYPPYGFTCPYTDHCPHLDGLSTTWVFEEYQRSEEVYQEHLRIIDILDTRLDASLKQVRMLEKENAELKAKNTAIHRRQFKANKAPSENDHERSGTKKRGAPPGHPGWSRPAPTKVDRTVHLGAPSICPHCGSDNLLTTGQVSEHLQEDIVLRPRTVVTRYVHEEAYCGRCRRSVVQRGEDELLHAPIGPVAKSVAIYLRYRIGMPYRKVQEVFSDLFGLHVVAASAVGFDRQAVKKGAALYEDLREKIKASAIIHADETSWRNDGLGHYAWYAGNPDLAFFHIDRHRSTEVARSILGPRFEGILVTDRYAAYNGADAHARQICLAHLIRQAKETSRELALIEDHDTSAEAFCANAAAFFSKACEIGRDLLAGTLPWSQAPRVEKRLEKS
jgi:transposase